MGYAKMHPETLQFHILEGRAYTERHRGTVNRNICAGYEQEVPRSSWETPPKLVQSGGAKMPWDFQTQTDKLVMANQPDIVAADKQKKEAVVIDTAVPSDDNIRKRGLKRLEKYQGLKEGMWK